MLEWEKANAKFFGRIEYRFFCKKSELAYEVTSKSRSKKRLHLNLHNSSGKYVKRRETSRIIITPYIQHIVLPFQCTVQFATLEDEVDRINQARLSSKHFWHTTKPKIYPWGNRQYLDGCEIQFYLNWACRYSLYFSYWRHEKWNSTPTDGTDEIAEKEA